MAFGCGFVCLGRSQDTGETKNEFLESSIHHKEQITCEFAYDTHASLSLLKTPPVFLLVRMLRFRTARMLGVIASALCEWVQPVD